MIVWNVCRAHNDCVSMMVRRSELVVTQTEGDDKLFEYLDQATTIVSDKPMVRCCHCCGRAMCCRRQTILCLPATFGGFHNVHRFTQESWSEVELRDAKRRANTHFTVGLTARKQALHAHTMHERTTEMLGLF